MPEDATLPLEDPPRLRPVEAIPVGSGSERRIWLRDSADRDLPPVALSDAAVALLSLLDGSRTVDEIARRVGGDGGPAPAEVRAFLEQLDRAGYLEGPRARARQTQRAQVYQQRPVRVAVHAGGAYPDGASELPAFLAAGYLAPEGPGSLPGARGDRPPPRGVIAPHVDLHRGAQTYSWAYRELAESQPADLYLVLGTSHLPVVGHFAATRKPYDTPLGTIPNDLEFVDRLQRLWGSDLYRGELAHAGEHSIEFQAVYLRSLGVAGEGAAPMVPILCGSLHSLVLPPHTPRDVAQVADFVAALRTAIRGDGRRITVIAAVDLAHVGRQFGDAWLTDIERMAWVNRDDRAMLELVAAGDAVGYFQQVLQDGDARRICGFTPMYLLTELLGEAAGGELLKYTQWVAPDLSSSVTFAAMLFR
ncbi:MAG: AmmeMemoRadiSam system protein B [Chloroflexi bacterium]|nr:AmmeMemoRadiSam system protein B [Chloroflexota bacterium]